MIKVTILASGIALGDYVPALLLRDNLIRRGAEAEVVLLESLCISSKPERIRLALKGQRLPSKVLNAVDVLKKKQLFTKWMQEKRYRFVLFSGHWLPLVDEYLRNSRYPLDKVDCIHMDAVVSSSWAAYMESSVPFHAIWPFSFRDNRVNTTIPISEETVPIYEDRPLQVLVRGGWEMDAYPHILPDLADAGIHSCCIVYSRTVNIRESPFMHYFWSNENGAPFGHQICDYPPLIDESGVLAFLPHTYNVFNLLVSCRAVISKPSGMTLLDSLESGTPVLFLPPVVAYEEYNARLWKSLGFGLDYEEWKSWGFPFEALAEVHARLRRCRKNIQGVEEQLYCLKGM